MAVNLYGTHSKMGQAKRKGNLGAVNLDYSEKENAPSRGGKTTSQLGHTEKEPTQYAQVS